MHQFLILLCNCKQKQSQTLCWLDCVSISNVFSQITQQLHLREYRNILSFQHKLVAATFVDTKLNLAWPDQPQLNPSLVEYGRWWHRHRFHSKGVQLQFNINVTFLHKYYQTHPLSGDFVLKSDKWHLSRHRILPDDRPSVLTSLGLGNQRCFGSWTMDLV